MSARSGIKKFSKKVAAAMIKEFKQLNDGAVPGNPIVIPTNPALIT